MGQKYKEQLLSTNMQGDNQVLGLLVCPTWITHYEPCPLISAMISVTDTVLDGPFSFEVATDKVLICED